MRGFCLILLSVCALGTTSPTAFEDDKSLEGVTIGYNLGDLELFTSASAGENDIEDNAAAFFNALDANQRNLLVQLIKDILEDFRDVVINGNDSIPPLDPLVVDHLGPFLYTTIGVRATADVNDLRMEGLKWYVVDDVYFNALRLTFGLQITIPRITITGRYSAQAAVGFINHNAGGNFRIFANRIVFSVDARLGTNILGGGHLTLRELDIKIDIHDTFIAIEGMTGSSLINGFINALVQSITQDVVQSEMENVSRLISEELFDVINDILKDYTLADILG